MTLVELDALIDTSVRQIATAHERLQAGDKGISYQMIDQQIKGLRELESRRAAMVGGTCRQIRICPGSGY